MSDPTQTNPSAAPSQPSTVPVPNSNTPPAAVSSQVSLALVPTAPAAPTVPRPTFRLSGSIKTFVGPVLLCNPSVGKTGLLSKPSHARTRRPQRQLKSRYSTSSPSSHGSGSLYERAVELVRNVRVGYKRDGKAYSMPMQYKGGFWLQESDAVRGIVLAGYLSVPHLDSGIRVFSRVRDGFDWVPKSFVVPFPQ